MSVYVYEWIIRPENGLALSLRVTAPNVIIAQRQLRRFIADHDGGSWIVECVSRETKSFQPARVPFRSTTGPSISAEAG